MGNSESYKPVTKVTGTEDTGDQTQDDLTFVFHTTEDDTPDRVVHDANTENTTWPYVVTSSGRLVAERRQFEELVDGNALLNQVKCGNAVEFVRPGKRFHWALYIGDNMFAHLKDGKISEVLAQDLVNEMNFGARIVNDIYKLKALPVVQIVNNARTQVGKALIWNNSESFVMWCRTGRTEFTNEEKQIQNLDSSTPKTTKGKYMLELHTPDETVMQRFSTLAELIDYRRNTEKFGKDYLMTNKYGLLQS